MSHEILMKRLGFPDSRLLRGILEYLMTEEEARVAAALPGSVDEVAERLGMDAERVRDILDGLFHKGVAIPRDFRKKDHYKFVRDIIQLHDATMASRHMNDPEFARLWKEFGDREMNPAVGRMLTDMGLKFWRVVPAYEAVKDLPDVLPYENIREMIEAQEKIAVVPCSCRNVTRLASDGCSFTDEFSTWHCIQFGRGAEYAIARGSGREISVEEALQIIAEAERDGLIHTWANTSKIVDPVVTVNCNCCGDCCEFFLSSRAANVPLGVQLEKSRYEAYVDDEACTGCQTCVKRCHFNAVEMFSPDGSRKLKARVIAEKCFGCGVCVVGCRQKAIRLKAVRPPEFIPD
ncbi:4Fe-4S dicluster domain-containing protein [Geoglobus acetivorans]|uniref:(Fe-S)-binding protein n=1 Tax=Geoglobus acetivorans TaxID=565033 RepID=A0ABZ3H4E8_GEOAI|nr:(Fe-S)-binding protein [Geoglobus acetivorans]